MAGFIICWEHSRWTCRIGPPGHQSAGPPAATAVARKWPESPRDSCCRCCCHSSRRHSWVQSGRYGAQPSSSRLFCSGVRACDTGQQRSSRVQFLTALRLQEHSAVQAGVQRAQPGPGHQCLHEAAGRNIRGLNSRRSGPWPAAAHLPQAVLQLEPSGCLLRRQSSQLRGGLQGRQEVLHPEECRAGSAGGR